MNYRKNYLAGSNGKLMMYDYYSNLFIPAKLFTKKNLHKINLRKERLARLRECLCETIPVHDIELIAVLEEMRESERINIPYIRHNCIITHGDIYIDYFPPDDVHAICFRHKKWNISDSTDLVESLYNAGREMFGEGISLERLGTTLWRSLLTESWE